MEVQCSSCSQRILVDASTTGQVFACPHCGQSLQMAAAPGPVTPTPVTPAPSVPVATSVPTPVQPIPQNQFAIAKDLPPSIRSSSRKGSRRRSDRGPRQSALHTVMGWIVLGWTLLCFAPLFLSMINIYADPEVAPSTGVEHAAAVTAFGCGYLFFLVVWAVIALPLTVVWLVTSKR